ncbi:NAD(P)-dependent oxidoreductase [Terrarubrum flagellatum]|uniref:NAD-dependent epimerase/dehydratase family protein n=1 Tax=Terrirubrum flagellatum TaxID=2895980 RepID=UPI0031455321
MKVLLTGAAGRIGTKLRRELAGRYELLRCFDRLPTQDLRENEEGIVGDISDLSVVERAMDSIDGVIHMAGVPFEADFDTLLPTNIIGLWNVYEAARKKGAKRVVFGSSNHAVGFYPRSETIDHTALPRPDSQYGLTKCWGEAVGALYADKYGVKSLHVRIGNAGEEPTSKRLMAIWISGRDLAQLCRIGLEHPAIHNDIVYGVSNNSTSWYDNSHAHSLGYAPQDSADAFAEAAAAGEAKVVFNPVERYYQGGLFCALEYAGDPVPQSDR